MLNNIIDILLLIFFAYYFFINFNKSIKILFISMLIAPNFLLGDLIIPFYILAFILFSFLGILFKFNDLVRLRLDILDIGLILIFLYVFINGLWHLALGFYDTYNLLDLFSYIRFLVLFIVLKKMNKNNFDDYIFPVLIINLLVAIYQFFVPSSIDLFYQLYGKPSYVVLQGYSMLGYFDRPTGTLLSPVVLGAYSLLCFSYYIKKRDISNYSIKIVCSILLGFLALSKTAILGIPFIFLLNILTGNINKKIILSSILVLFLLLIGVSIYGYYNQDKIAQLTYYFDFLLRPLDALNTRYGSSGNVDYFYSLVQDHMIFGLGSTEIGNINIVDSLYVSTLAEGGIILLISYLIWLWRTSYNYLVFIAILLSGVGGSYFFSILLLPFLCSSSLGNIKK